MRFTFDLVQEVVLLMDEHFNIVDAFEVRGRTERNIPSQVVSYTYKSHTILPSTCGVCGRGIDELQTPCVSRHQFHAIVPPNEMVPEMHRLDHWNLNLLRLAFEDMVFYLEPDHLFNLKPSSFSV